MQLSDLRTRVRYYLREATANTWTDVELNALINLAQRHVAFRLDTHFLTQLVQVSTLSFASVNNADLPSTFLKTLADPYNDSTGDVYPLKPVQDAISTISETYDSNSLFVNKRVSWITNNDLYIRPTPGSTITLSFPYIKYPDDLAADANESEIPDGVVDLVIIKAAADALIKTRQLQDSSLLLKQLEQRIEMLNRSVEK